MFNNWLIKLEDSFTARLCKQFSLERIVTTPEKQAFYDRLTLTFTVWPFFYFSYSFAKSFEQRIKLIVSDRNATNPKEELINISQLHYLSAILSLSFKELRKDKLFRNHFSEIQAVVYAISSSDEITAENIIDDALSEMLYHDITYNWSRSPAFGEINNYYSAKSLLHMMKRKIEN